MSHNKNYSKFSAKEKEPFKENEDGQLVIDEVVEEPVTEEVLTETVTEEIHEEPVTSLTGVVDGCDKLYVRSEASTNSDPVCTILQSALVTIDIENSTDDFYKVKTSEGVEGYCMKKFIVTD